jgi:quercetin dioxygenase-like cupin family protein
MIRSGDTIYNKVTGETITFLATSKDTDGEAVVIETVVQPDGFVAAAHVHPSQSERFAVAEGTLALKVDGKEMTLEAGDVAIVEAGQAHKFWNAGDEPVKFVCEVRPALQFESLLETMFSLAAEGKTNRKGMPNPLRLAVIAKRHFDTVQLPFPPAWMQAAGLAIGAPLGKLVGYGETYEGAEEKVPARAAIA